MSRIVIFLFIMCSTLTNNLYAMQGHSKGSEEKHRRSVQGKYVAKIQKDPILFEGKVGTFRGRKNRYFLVQTLSLIIIFGLINPVGFDVSSSPSVDPFGPIAPIIPRPSISGTEVSQSYRASPSPYFSLQDPIPQQNRSALYVALENAYRQAEACEPDTVAILKTLPSSHPFKDLLKQCDQIDANYISPQTLSALRIPFDKEIPAPQFKVVPQFTYSLSEDETLFTGNVMKCVAIAIYNPLLKRGGLAHVAGENVAYLDAHLKSRESSKTGIHEFMESVVGAEDPADQRVTLLSGSKAHLEYYISLMKKFGFVKFNIFQKDEWGLSKNSFYNKDLSKGSLALDTRDGRVYRIENDKVVNQWMGPPEKFLTPEGKTYPSRLIKK
ncbi:MAG: hypothetical protein K2P93_00505 [Alphaproteobacteria bacterium]|nr:hypothetical protein [Alphaproteobacteria bacterium]